MKRVPRSISTIIQAIRIVGFLTVVVGLVFRLLHWPGANECLLVGGGMVMLALASNLLAGGWQMSQADEKIRLVGHLLILYGFATYLQWFRALPFGFQAILSGLLLLLLATWLRRRRLREEEQGSFEDRIEEIGREPSSRPPDDA